MKWLLCIALVTTAATADARPGGGDSFSSDSDSDSGWGDVDFGDAHIEMSREGAIGLTVTLLIVAAIFGVFMLVSKAMEYDTPPKTPFNSSFSLGALRDMDPDFSRAMFEDFAFRLYADAHRARDDLKRFAPYFTPVALDKLKERPGSVSQVAVGALELLSVRFAAPCWRLVVRYRANLAGETTRYVVERWIYSRSGNVRTKPLATRIWPCPSCGAPWQAGTEARTCAHCGESIEAGKFSWTVDDVFLDETRDVGATLTGTVPEVGNDYKTVISPDATSALAKLLADDPALTWDAFRKRVDFIYERLNEGWNADNLQPVRGLLTGALRDYLRYWLDEYRKQGLSNHLKDARVLRIELAKIENDRWYDAITVRVFATGFDYTTRGTEIVGGASNVRRDYTEYWTFVRSATRRGKTVAEPVCPNCGAPLQISDAGTCDHCQAELENGSFDWVLSKIEQDDVYSG